MNIRNSYTALDVKYGASMEEIKQSYRDLVRVWHPDRFTEDPRLRKKAEEKLKEINRAYGNVMSFTAHETRMIPDTGLHLFSPWWRRYVLGIGRVAARIAEYIYDCARYCLNRLDLGWIHQTLFSPRTDGVTGNIDADIVRHSTDEREKRAGTDGFQKEMDFAAVFDELARERRASLKRNGPAKG